MEPGYGPSNAVSVRNARFSDRTVLFLVPSADFPVRSSEEPVRFIRSGLPIHTRKTFSNPDEMVVIIGVMPGKLTWHDSSFGG